MPRGLPRGDSRSLLCSSKREAPRDEPVASSIFSWDLLLAAIVKLHGTSPWHLVSSDSTERTPTRPHAQSVSGRDLFLPDEELRA